ncbi:hypothetical protein P171DRAFT_501539 [Karstenula rhodostoma CBS 690.94]|uniref:Uncharacterized protein n=1 Tax=Karstenula rhodostoma CBS 690.94 TaxID=1392251 RepID=A0A9P4PAB2_9PLEO|nr:hypothetical protein P171DRAFT_501539 [Karstenula rhodostoma CBS 690.94]
MSERPESSKTAGKRPVRNPDTSLSPNTFPSTSFTPDQPQSNPTQTSQFDTAHLPDPMPRDLQNQINELNSQMHSMEPPHSRTQAENQVLGWLKSADGPAIARMKVHMMTQEFNLHKQVLAKEFADLVQHELFRSLGAGQDGVGDRALQTVHNILNRLGDLPSSTGSLASSSRTGGPGSMGSLVCRPRTSAPPTVISSLRSSPTAPMFPNEVISSPRAVPTRILLPIGLGSLAVGATTTFFIGWEAGKCAALNAVIVSVLAAYISDPVGMSSRAHQTWASVSGGFKRVPKVPVSVEAHTSNDGNQDQSESKSTHFTGGSSQTGSSTRYEDGAIGPTAEGGFDGTTVESVGGEATENGENHDTDAGADIAQSSTTAGGTTQGDRNKSNKNKKKKRPSTSMRADPGSEDIMVGLSETWKKLQ